MKIWRNKEGRVRLIWRLIGIVGMVFLIGLAAWPVLLFIGTRLGYSGHELIEVVERRSFYLSPLILLGVVVLFAFVFDKMKARDMGLSLGRERGHQFLFGFGLGGTLVALVFFLHLIINYATVDCYGWQVYHFSDLCILLAEGLLIFSLVSFSEELLGRGYFINHFAGSSLLAALTSSLFFGFLHLLNPSLNILAFINICFVGVLFAYMYLWSGSLLMPIGFHLSWNWFMGYVFNYPVSGVVNKGSLFIISVEGPELVTGGSFGPEASLPVTLILCLGFYLTKRFLQKRRFLCPINKKISSKLTPL